MRLLVSNKGYKVKPLKKIQDNEFQDLDSYSAYTQIGVRTFAQLCADGHTFIPAYFNDGAKRRKKADAAGVNAIGLDMDDSTVAPEEFVKYAESVGLVPNFYYYTFSQDPTLIGEMPDDRYIHKSANFGVVGEVKSGYRYRVVWLLDEEIPVKTFGEVIKVLMEYTFKQYNFDKSCKDPSRLFFGSNTYAVVVNDEPTKLSSLGWAKIMEASAKGIVNNNLHNQKKAGAPEWEEVEIPEAVKVDTKWMCKLRPFCELWDKWMNGEYIDYNQRLTLWSNLKFLKCTTATKPVIAEIMSYVKPDVWKGHTFGIEEIQKKFRDKSLKPAPIVKYQGKRMSVPEFFSTAEKVIEVRQDGFVSLEELDKYMDAKVPEVMLSDGLTYFQSQTASGKTERIIDNYIERKFHMGKEIYCVPTHILAKEFEERLLAKDKDFPVYRIGETKYNASESINLYLGLPANHKDEERSEVIKKLFDNETNGLFITTHQFLLYVNKGLTVDRIIVDENIDENLVKNAKISIGKLNNLKRYVEFSHQYLVEDIIEAVSSGNKGDIVNNTFSMILEHFDLDKYKDELTEDEMIEGLYNLQDAFLLKVSRMNGNKCLRAVLRNELLIRAQEKGIPIKLFTATPLSQRIKNYYDIQFEIVEAPWAQTMGEVIAFRGTSGARGKRGALGMSDAKAKQLAAYIKSKLSDKEIRNSFVISYKGTDKFWQEQGFNTINVDATEIHLSNSAGLDFLKGKNLIIAGKYDLPPEWYEDLWSDIGVGEMPLHQNKRIFHNGIYQSFYHYDNEALMKEQIEIMEYKTQQAIGRARALRTDAKVYVFGNYVPKGVCKVYD